MPYWNVLRQRLLLALGNGIILMAASSASAQSIAFGFPVTGQNPYTAPIITVVDHSTDYFYDQNHHSVVAYTGEMGKDQCGPSGEPCGYYNPNFVPGNDTDTRQFIVNGSYVGTSADCPNGASSCLEKVKILNYRGHPGYDYAFAAGTQIVAAQDGVLYIPASDPINNFGGGDPWCKFHTFFIDHGNGWTTWYLHADHLTVGQTPHSCPSAITADEKIATVHKGDPIAVVGSTGVAVSNPHLHFEVRRGCDFASGSVQNCLVVDPYGWEWWTSDTIQNTVCASDHTKYCATTQIGPLWNLPDWNIHQPLVTSISLASTATGFSATIIGQNFNPGALVTVWSRQGQYHMANLTPLSLTASQIVVQIPSTLVSDPGLIVLKIRNPQGPRSVAATLSLPTSTSSVPLVIIGSQAPGGGTFAGMGGFQAANDRGETTFLAGIDTNGDGAPDQFEDYEFSSGQIIKLAVPGFKSISSVATHTRRNNRGDMAFGDVNGTLGAAPAGIYLLNSGASVPIQIAVQGGACPTPCPLPGSPTLSQLTGPLAIDDAGDVTFAATLVDPQTHLGTCCFLFLYSASDGKTIKVAADGPTGDPSPVGGIFALGSLLGNMHQITSDGDVIFFAQVTGGSSPAGIFRFSRTQGISKLVAQGDPAPGAIGGTLGLPLMGPVGSVSGRQLVFHAPVKGSSSGQIIAIIKDVTQNNPVSALVAYEGQPTGTSAGGVFSDASHLPFGGFGENTAPPWVRADGTVVFHSLLVGAVDSAGDATDRGVFLWNSKGFQKVIVDGDQIAAGEHVGGVFSPAINNRGEVFYFVARLQ